MEIMIIRQEVWQMWMWMAQALFIFASRPSPESKVESTN